MTTYIVQSRYITEVTQRLYNAVVSGYVFANYKDAKTMMTYLNCEEVAGLVNKYAAIGCTPPAWELDRQYSKWYIKKVEQAIIDDEDVDINVYDQNVKEYIAKVHAREEAKNV